jgi:hypothetical protein
MNNRSRRKSGTANLEVESGLASQHMIRGGTSAFHVERGVDNVE